MTAAKNKGGRPTIYRAALAARFCAKLAAERGGHRKVCAAPGMPAPSTIFAWRLKHPEFRDAMNAAQVVRAFDLAEEIIGIADDCAAEPGAVAKARLKSDNRKWLAARLAPKDLGDKLAHVGGDDSDAPIRTEIVRRIVRAPDRHG